MRCTVVVLACGVGACSLGFGDGFSSGPEAADAGTDALANDGGVGSTDGGRSGVDAGGDVTTNTDAGAPDPDLVGWWKLDETSGSSVGDSSSFGGNTGTIIGAATWTASGKRGGALDFDGASRVEVPSHPSMKLSTKVTLAFWIRVDTNVPDARVFAYNYGFSVKLNGLHPQLEMSAGYSVADVVVAVGQWHHIAFTFDAGVVNAFYDGFPVPLESNTLGAGKSFTADDDSVTIGSAKQGTYNTNGALDDVRLYRRVLSAQEIDSLVK